MNQFQLHSKPRQLSKSPYRKKKKMKYANVNNHKELNGKFSRQNKFMKFRLGAIRIIRSLYFIHLERTYFTNVPLNAETIKTISGR